MLSYWKHIFLSQVYVYLSTSNQNNNLICKKNQLSTTQQKKNTRYVSGTYCNLITDRNAEKKRAIFSLKTAPLRKKEENGFFSPFITSKRLRKF